MPEYAGTKFTSNEVKNLVEFMITVGGNPTQKLSPPRKLLESSAKRAKIKGRLPGKQSFHEHCSTKCF